MNFVLVFVAALSAAAPASDSVFLSTVSKKISRADALKCSGWRDELAGQQCSIDHQKSVGVVMLIDIFLTKKYDEYKKGKLAEDETSAIDSLIEIYQGTTCSDFMDVVGPTLRPPEKQRLIALLQKVQKRRGIAMAEECPAQ